MKLFYRIKRLFGIRAEKLVSSKENGIEVYQYELKKAKEGLEKLSKSQSEIRAKRQMAIDDLEKAKAQVIEITRVLDLAVKENNESVGEEAIVLLDANNQKISLYEKNIAGYEAVLKTTEVKYLELKDTYQENKIKLDSLKVQSEFVENMKLINGQLENSYGVDGIESGTFIEIENQIKKEIYYEADRSAQLSDNSPQSIEQRLLGSRKSKFEQYKEQKLALESGEKPLIEEVKEAK